MLAKKVIAIVATISLMGCDQFFDHRQADASQQPQAQPPRLQVTHPIGRFEKLQNFRVDAALDSQTGQLCKTWEWVTTDRKHPDPYETLQLCSTLYKDFPTATDIPNQVLWGTDNATGRRVVSHDGGKSWQWASGNDAPAQGVTMDQTK